MLLVDSSIELPPELLKEKPSILLPTLLNQPRAIARSSLSGIVDATVSETAISLGFPITISAARASADHLSVAVDEWR